MEIPLIINVLNSLTSHDPSVRVPAERFITENELTSSFLPKLMEISLLRREIDPAIRTLAVICLKNAIQKHWKVRKPFGKKAKELKSQNNKYISDEDKQYIRQKLLDNCLDEPNKQVSTQFEIVVAKIARYDYPSNWPDLISRLVAPLETLQELLSLFPSGSGESTSGSILLKDRSENDMLMISRQYLIVKRSLSTLLSVIADLASKRLGNDKDSFSQLSVTMFPGVHNLFTITAKLLMSNLQSKNILSQISAEYCSISAKILYWLVLYGIPDIENSKEISLLFEQSIELLQSLDIDDIYFSNMEDSTLLAVTPISDSIRRILSALGDIIRECQVDRSLEFIPSLYKVLSFMFNHLVSRNTSQRSFSIKDRGNIMAMNFISNVLSCDDFKETEEAMVIIQEFFTYEKIQQLLQILIGRDILALRIQEDLQEWLMDPEDYFHIQESLMKEEHVRPSGEHLFSSLLQQEPFRNWACTLLLQSIEQHEKAYPIASIFTSKEEDVEKVNISQLVKEKDVLYLLLGLASSGIRDNTDFLQQFYQATILPILATASSVNIKWTWDIRIIVKRALWLLGCLATDIPSDFLSRLSIHKILLNLCSTTNANGTVDSVVRLSACETFTVLINNWYMTESEERDALSATNGAKLHNLTSFIDGDAEEEEDDEKHRKHEANISVSASASTSATELEANSLITSSYNGQLQCEMESLVAARALIMSVASSEAKVKVVEMLHAVVLKSKTYFIPYIPAILELIPMIWSNEGLANYSHQQAMNYDDDFGLLRKEVIMLLKLLLVNCGLNDNLASIIKRVLAYSLNPLETDNASLKDEAVVLWDELMKRVKLYDVEIHELFRYAPTIIINDFEQLKEAMHLVENYIIIGGEAFFLGQYTISQGDGASNPPVIVTGAALVHEMLRLSIGNVKPRGAVFICRSMETIFVRFPSAQVAQEFDFILQNIFTESCFIDAKNKDVEPDIVIAGYLTIIARAFVSAGHGWFWEFIIRAGTKHELQPPSLALCKLLDAWIDKFDVVTYTSAGLNRKKVWCNAMVQCLRYVSVSDIIQELLPKVSLIVGVCAELVSAETSNVQPLQGNEHEVNNGKDLEDENDLIHEYVYEDGFDEEEVEIGFHQNRQARTNSMGNSTSKFKHFSQYIDARDNDFGNHNPLLDDSSIPIADLQKMLMEALTFVQQQIPNEVFQEQIVNEVDAVIWKQVHTVVEID